MWQVMRLEGRWNSCGVMSLNGRWNSGGVMWSSVQELRWCYKGILDGYKEGASWNVEGLERRW